MTAEVVTVVGGGIAGLVVARDLAVAGVPVILREASPRLGGQIEQVELAGRLLDIGAESFATRGGTVAALLADLGLDGEVTPPLDSPAWVHRADGTACALPATAVLGIPSRPLARDVVRAIGSVAAVRAACDAVLPRGSRRLPDPTLGAVVRARMGDAVVRGLVDPVVRGVYSTGADDLALATASPALASALTRTRRLAVAARQVRAAAPAGSQVAGVRGGLGAVVAALAADARAHGAALRTDDPVTAGELAEIRVAGPVVVAAVGLASTATTSRTLTVVAAAVEGLTGAPRGTGVLVAPDAPGVTARALTHSSVKWPWLAGDAALVRLSYDAPPTDGDVERDVRLLSGSPEARVLAVVRRTWTRTIAVAASPEQAHDGAAHLVGEASGRTGLAAIVAHARSVAASLAGTTTDTASGPTTAATTATTSGTTPSLVTSPHQEGRS